MYAPLGLNICVTGQQLQDLKILCDKFTIHTISSFLNILVWLSLAKKKEKEKKNKRKKTDKMQSLKTCLRSQQKFEKMKLKTVHMTTLNLK